MAERAMSAAPGRFDALLTQLAQQHGGVESLLDSFFDFLHRKTDFYAVSSDPATHKMGFLPGQAEQKVLAAFRKYPLRSLDGGDYGAASKAGSSTKTETQSSTAAASTGAKQKTEDRAAAAKKTEDLRPKLTEDGKQVPVGNGGVAANYTWTQTLEDVSIQMELPQGTRAKDLACQIESTRLRVAMKSDPSKPLLEGELPEKIRADESIWSLESNHTLNISLEKIKPTWWASALNGGPEIDTSQVDSRRNIQEYDEATQGAIRKAVFDQRQQQLHGEMPLTPEEKMMQEAKNLPGSPFLPSVQQS
ncbi:Nuclear migration protein nudC-like protein [Phytophthora cinnamomi]|uniref:Nuclear migration protein nudC-like protein n=1 Tax=Phytophthora cinnamomi TaxID=4785 RepID=UPI003559CC3F|nr:Nuclear migration protein nudC-like protein [Phytophthora cinnamomi]